MNRMVMKVWIPVTIPYVEVAYYDNSIVQVDNILTEELESVVVAVRVDIDNEVDILINVKG